MTPRPRRRRPALPLRTDRLVLRDFTAADAAAVVAWACDPRVTRHLLYGPRTARAARRHLAAVLRGQRLRPRRSWELAVALAGAERLIGACDLALVAPHEAALGYLLRPAHWGRGYGSEIARTLVRVAFETLAVHRVVSAVTVGNVRSARVLANAGLRWEATLRRHGRVGHRWLDVDVYALERADWTAGCA